MIRVQVDEHAGQVTAFQVTGHAGYGSAGSDVVCAAVSALVLNAINSCEKLLGVELEAQDDGHLLQCQVRPQAHAEEVQLLIRSMLFGIEQTKAKYPRYVELTYRTK
ncbi:ribosomal-processing cysteine protease Prp [Alicyclobacillus cycloheptanicus]|uniref:Ribosomal processing cysteine protease Prp n=1 Tax=Alicyclobacillus cycloheptanicus TaxID=1457 RepID=A0ABT9XEZ6_9BACL|nr:ribosomal-processing cysteine protease Prp [Alicyclobacillus cycloheptanicus]MDQ0188326.1 uncharacterized protein YsxB (DUF464 family) [Alicyclobacillus cycloheptanicus]WDM01040.1 ribosomal-processing cysteine protease Prp [Alicyclobacillus cycloheptanicus]